MLKKIMFFCVCLLSSIILLSANAEEKKQSPLIVGTTSGYAPYVSLNAEGKYEGFDIDFAYLLGKKLGREIIIQDFGSMPSLMMALKQGKADMLIWAVSITKDRMEKLEMVYYQGATIDTTPFLFWEKVPTGVQSISDLEKLSNNIVCVEAGSSQEDIVKEFPKLAIKYVDKVLDVIMDLKYGKCLTTTIDPGLIPGYVQKYPQLKVINLPIPENQKIYGNGIAIAKKNQKLAGDVKAAVAALTMEGKIAELEKKWNLEQ